MKKIILFFAVALMLSACGASSSKGIEIAQNEQGLYGLKSGSKWVAEPVYTKLVLKHFDCGDFYIAQEIPGTQQYYHVVFDSAGKEIKRSNIYCYYSDGWLQLVDPKGTSSNLFLSTGEEKKFDIPTVGYVYKDIFSE
jgi:hypothetical protein